VKFCHDGALAQYLSQLVKHSNDRGVPAPVKDCLRVPSGIEKELHPQFGKVLRQRRLRQSGFDRKDSNGHFALHQQA
jgi:hypothetical protein